MVKTSFFYIILLAGYVSCCASLSSSFPSVSFFDSNNLWHSISAAITGAVLSSSSFLFFIRRLVGQYDNKHIQHEKDILDMQQIIKNLDVSLFNKLHEQTEDIRQELQKSNEASTNIIVTSIKDIKKDLQSMVTDVALLNADRRRCLNISEKIEQNSNDITIVSVKHDALAASVGKLEKYVNRHIETERKK